MFYCSYCVQVNHFIPSFLLCNKTFILGVTRHCDMLPLESIKPLWYYLVVLTDTECFSHHDKRVEKGLLCPFF